MLTPYELQEQEAMKRISAARKNIFKRLFTPKTEEE
jgi:hypothetical protein